MKKKVIIQITGIVLATLILDVFLQYQLFRLSRNNEIMEASFHAANLRSQLEKEITGGLLLVQGLADYIAVNPGVTHEQFAHYAELALADYPLIRNIGAAPDYVLDFIYPLEGNEAAIGVDYRKLPRQWEQVRLVGETGKLVVAGPLALVQGGTGLIGRAPVFVNNGQERSSWGIVSSVIDVEKLLKVSGVIDSHYNVALRGVNGQGSAGDIFYGDEQLFRSSQEAVLMTVYLPGGEWQMAVKPYDGWSIGPPPLSIPVHLVLLLFALLLSTAAFRTIKKNHIIDQSRRSLDDAQAIAHLGSWRMNIGTRQVWWSDELYRIFGVDKNTHSPDFEKRYEMIHPDDIDLVLATLEQVIESCSTQMVEHRIHRIDGAVRYVQTRIERKEDQENISGTMLDITERKRAEDALKASEEMMRAMSEASYDALIAIDQADSIIFWGPAAERMLGWRKEEVLGHKLHDLISPLDLRQEAKAGIAQFGVSGQGPVVGSVLEVPTLRKDGTIMSGELSVAPFTISGQYHAVGILRDITERKEVEKKLRVLATTDALTGLFNRGRFMELALQEIKRSRRYNTSFSIIMADVDRFKKINDTYGHNVGDEVLRNLAATSTAVLREADIIGRLGGEEFAIATPETNLEGSCEVAGRLRRAFEEASMVLDDGQQIRYTVSLGVACLKNGEETLEALLKRADRALYQAKEGGRNRVVCLE